MWRADYLFNEELKLSFMASNLVSGMLQRIEKLRKYAFASVLIFGQNYSLTVTGIWILRGQQLAFNVSINSINSLYNSHEYFYCVCQVLLLLLGHKC